MKLNCTPVCTARLCKLLLPAVVAIFYITNAKAATKTWSNATLDGNFNNGANWTGGLPTASDDAVVPFSTLGYITVTGNITVNSLSITTTSSIIGVFTFTVNSGVSFGVNGNATINCSNTSIGLSSFQLTNLGTFSVGGSFSATANVTTSGLAITQLTVTNQGTFTVTSNYSCTSNSSVGLGTAQSYFTNQGNFTVSGNLSCTSSSTAGLASTQNTITNQNSLTVNGNLVLTANSPTASASTKNVIDNESTLYVAGNLSCTNTSTSGSIFSNAISTNHIVNAAALTINGNTTTLFQGTNSLYNNRIILFGSEDGSTTTFNGDVDLSASLSSATSDTIGFAGKGVIGTTRATSTGQVVFKKSLTLGARARYVRTSSSSSTPVLPGSFLFDGTTASTQTVTINSATQFYFSNFQVGNANSPVVTLAGTANAQVYNGSITANNNAILDLAARNLNRSAAGGSITLNNTSTLKLAGTSGGQGTSNFPTNFSSYSFYETSTVEYNATAAQTVFQTPVYGNLTLSRVSGTGSIKKTAAGALTVQNNLTINTWADFDPSGSNYSISVGRDWTNNGSYTTRSALVTFNTSKNAIISGSSSTAFSQLYINKPSSINTTIEINGSGAVSASNGFTMTINSGLLRINTGGSFTKTTNDGIQINSGGGIEVNGGNFTSNASITNDGLFRSITGTSAIGNATGQELQTRSGASLDIQGGTLTFSGRLINTAGSASITGGSVTLNTVGNASTSAGSFDMSLSTNLTISGSPIIYFQNAATGGRDLYILNSIGTKSISGGTFQFGNSSTPANSIFQCYSAGSNPVSVYNVSVNSGNSPKVNLQSDITLTGTLTLNSTNSSGAFLLNGYTLTAAQITGSGKLTGSQQSGLIITGSTPQTLRFTANVFPSAPNNNYLKTFTLNNNTNVTLADSLNIAANTFVNPGVITVGGTLNTAGLLTLKSDVSGDARVGQSASGTVVNGEVMVERYIPARRAWRFMSVPFASSSQSIRQAWQEGATPYPTSNISLYSSNPVYNPKPGYGTAITYYYDGGANGFDANRTSNPSLYGWDPAAGTEGGWTAVGSTNDPLTNKSAYYLFVRGDRSIDLSLGTAAGTNTTTLRAKGVLNENAGGDITYNLGDYSSGRRLFVSNPFASPIDLSEILKVSRAQPNITADKFWVWDPTFSYQSYPYNVGYYITYQSGIQVPSGSTYIGDKFAQSGQAFMVEAAGTGNASITIKQSDKVNTGLIVFGLQAPEKKEKAAGVPVIYTNLINPALDSIHPVDGVGAGFGRKYSDTVSTEDAGKMWNQNESMALWRHGKPLAIEFRPIPKQTDTLFYKLYLYLQPYRLKIFSANLPGNLPAEAWLVDKYLGTQTPVNLYDTTAYNFTPNADTNSYINRFMLVFNRTGKSGGKLAKTSAGNPQASMENGGAGIKIYPNPVSGSQANLQLAGLKAGRYEIAVYNANGDKLATRTIQHGGSGNYALDINRLWPSGIYTVQLSGTSLQQPLTVQLVISR